MIEKWGQLVDLLMENVFVTYFTIFFTKYWLIMEYEVIFEKWYYVVHIYIVQFIHFNDETWTFLQYTGLSRYIQLVHQTTFYMYSAPLSADQHCEFWNTSMKLMR